MIPVLAKKIFKLLLGEKPHLIPKLISKEVKYLDSDYNKMIDEAIEDDDDLVRTATLLACMCEEKDEEINYLNRVIKNFYEVLSLGHKEYIHRKKKTFEIVKEQQEDQN